MRSLKIDTFKAWLWKIIPFKPYHPLSFQHSTSPKSLLYLFLIGKSLMYLIPPKTK